MENQTASQPESKSSSGLAPNEVKTAVDGYISTFESGVERRKEQYSSFVNTYYDLVTNFYLFGWGKSFHFAPRRRGESLKDSINRAQNYLADQLSLKPGMNVIDLGCGVGGPLTNLVRTTGAHITGINNNGYQLEIARKNSRDISTLCNFIQGDFMQIPESDNKFNSSWLANRELTRPSAYTVGVSASTVTAGPADTAGRCLPLRNFLETGSAKVLYPDALTLEFQAWNIEGMNAPVPALEPLSSRSSAAPA